MEALECWCGVPGDWRVGVVWYVLPSDLDRKGRADGVDGYHLAMIEQ